MLRTILVAAVLCFIVGVMPAQGGLNISLSPNHITAGEPCENVTATFSNLVAGHTYQMIVQVLDSSGAPVPGFTIEFTQTADAQGQITGIACVELVAGNYRVNGIALGGTPILTGSATLTSA